MPAARIGIDGCCGAPGSAPSKSPFVTGESIPSSVVAGLVRAIHVLIAARLKDVDARDERGMTREEKRSK